MIVLVSRIMHYGSVLNPEHEFLLRNILYYTFSCFSIIKFVFALLQNIYASMFLFSQFFTIHFCFVLSLSGTLIDQYTTNSHATCTTVSSIYALYKCSATNVHAWCACIFVFMYICIHLQ